jgi:hypothetical protein
LYVGIGTYCEQRLKTRIAEKIIHFIF